MPKRRYLLVVLLLLASPVWLRMNTPDDPLPSLDDLLDRYRTLGLPLPRTEARLVRYEARASYILNDVLQPSADSLAFEVKPATVTEGPTLLAGTQEWQLSRKTHIRQVDPEPAASDLVFRKDDALILAIQCHARGWDRLAQSLLERSRQDAQTWPRLPLPQLAWSYWKDHLTLPMIDRAPVAKRLNELLRQYQELDDPYNRSLLRSLDLALVPSTAEPGSIRALIDDLVDYNANVGRHGDDDPDERYQRIADLGFAAVPDLIEHLNDERLTRAMMVGFNNFKDWNLSVKYVVSDLLEGLAGQELMRGLDEKDAGKGWLYRQIGYPVTVSAARQWWEDAREVGEEAYLRQHVLPARGKEGERQHVRSHLLNLIVTKYPSHIPSLYHEILEKRPDVSSDPLADAVLQCRLSAREKLALFTAAAKHKDISHRLPALHAPKALDAALFNSLLLAEIEALPEDVPGTYWTCPEVYMARLALEASDPQVWPTLERVAKRSVVGLRMELLAKFSNSGDTPHRRERFRLLESFWDDTELRDRESSPKFEGPCASFSYRRIEVRDFVALHIANMLKIPIELKLDRTPDEWADIRSRVQETLKRELAELE